MAVVLVYMRSNDNSSGSEIYYHICIEECKNCAIHREALRFV